MFVIAVFLLSCCAKFTVLSYLCYSSLCMVSDIDMSDCHCTSLMVLYAGLAL